MFDLRIRGTSLFIEKIPIQDRFFLYNVVNTLRPYLNLSHRRLKGKPNPVLVVSSVLQCERHIVKYSTSDE